MAVNGDRAAITGTALELGRALALEIRAEVQEELDDLSVFEIRQS